jgi:hypothetical protein
VLLLLVFAAGCGGGDALPRERVSGKVTLDGRSLPAGSIQFLPEGGGDATNPALSAGATINEGEYDIPRQSGLLPGKYMVTISAAAGGAAPANGAPGPAEALAKDVVPEKYNKNSTLTAEVKAGGENTFNFDLTSK